MTLDTSQSELPRLLYLADVPVEASYHGSALVFRLLNAYPANRLCIVETCGRQSEPERRGKDVVYKQIHIGPERWVKSRISRLAASWIALTSSHRCSIISSRTNGFQPEAVLTVSHGYSWMTAAEYALRNQLPLHLI